ncbi:MAG: VOC family protein [Eubacteriales bacterium]|nr:VOC family protein [Clostridiales bacterium]
MKRLSYSDFLTYLSLILMAGTLAAAVAKCVFIFPPYMLSPAPSADKTGALDSLIVPSVASGICVLLSCGRDLRFGMARALPLALCALTVAAGAAALKLGNTYDALNYVPPAVFFAAFAAIATVARVLIFRRGTGARKGFIAAVVCALPAALISLGAIAAVLSGHKLIATLVLLFLPVPFCAASALACAAAVSRRSAIMLMCLPLPVCIFCATRTLNFGGAYGAATVLSVIFTAAAAASVAEDVRKTRKLIKGDTAMANKVISGMGFHHIALKAHNFEESLKFYTEGLGMKPLAGWGEGDGRIQMLDIGDGTILELFAGGSEHAETGRYIHLAFCCDDVDAAFAAAVKAGAKVKTEPATVPLDSKPQPMTLRVAFVYGPSGEELEFFKVVE